MLEYFSFFFCHCVFTFFCVFIYTAFLLWSHVSVVTKARSPWDVFPPRLLLAEGTRGITASFLLSAEKEETVVKEKVGKKEPRIFYSCMSLFFFLFSNRWPSWQWRGPVNRKLCSYSNSPDILRCCSTYATAVQPTNAVIEFIAACLHSFAHAMHSILRDSIQHLCPIYSCERTCTVLVKKQSENLRHPTN